MKKVYLSLLFAGLISISMSFGQQIPFQGRLLETGIPVEGTRDFDFSIDVDGDVWTESHAGVPVNEGLYSVVLGSSSPLPSDLFKGVDSRDLNISVNGTPMSPIQVFAPPTSYYFENSDPSDMRPALHAVMSGNTTGWATIEGESYADTDATGIYGNGSSAVDGTSLGVYGRAQGPGKYNKGLYGIGLGTGNGATGTGFGQGSINFGVEGNASGNTWNNTGVEGSNYGAAGEWNFGIHGISNAGTGTTVENHGVAGRAFGPGKNYGVYGQAADGVENWAGWFEGDVKITGTLDANIPQSTSFSFTQSDTPTLDAIFNQPVGYYYNIDHDLVSGSTAFRAIQVDVSGLGRKYATRSNVTSVAGDDSQKIGLLGSATGDGTGNHTGVFGQAFGKGLFNAAIEGTAGGEGNGVGSSGFDPNGSYNTGVVGNAFSNLHGNTGVFGHASGATGFDNIGVVGWSEVTSGEQNTGVLGWAKGPGVNKGIVGMATGGTENWAGWFDGDVKIDGNQNINSNASAGGDLRAFELTQTVDADVTNQSVAARIIATGDGAGDGDQIAIISVANGNNRFYNTGLWGRAIGTGNGNPGSENYGVYGQASNNSKSNVGTSGIADGTSEKNVGIYGQASGATENWAGWFDGDVKVTGSLVSSGSNPLQLTNGTDLRAEMAFESDGGVFNAYGSTNQIVAAIGASNTNDAQGFMGVFNSTGGVNGFMKVQDDGTGGEKGRLVVYNNVDGKSVTLDGGRGQLSMYGSSKNNVYLGSKWWDNPDHGMMVLYGSVEVDDGGGPYLPDLVALETIDAGGGNEMGKLVLRNTDGSIFEIDANGINASGDIGVSGNISSNDLNTGFINSGADVHADGNIQSGTFDGATGSGVIMFNYGDIDMSQNLNAAGDINAVNGNFSGVLSSGDGTVQTSDRRLKENISTINNALENSLKLRGVTYTWKDQTKSRETQIGVIAQEVEEVYPEFVHTNDEGMKAVNYAQMTAVLIEAIKELNEKIESLESENAELRASLDQASTNSEQIKSLQKQINTLVALMGSGQASDIKVTGEEK